MKSILQITVLVGVLFYANVLSADDSARAIELFEKHVRPTLVEHCVRCHGAKKQQGGLRLDSPTGLTKGGDSGAAVVPGDPNDSLLIEAIRYNDPGLEMPPKGKLPQKTIQAFEEWVKRGASDPRQPLESSKSSSPTIEEGREFWAFQPVRQQPPPTVKNVGWPIRDLDHFVLANQESCGLVPAPDANRFDLIRRVYIDLTGLPPSQQAIDAFIRDDSDDAYEKVVDGLLESVHFGERWGRHWLDVVRYAESSGGGRTLLFPNAWRYRDYVVESFNRDLPYDQFLREQIAGDLLQHEDWEQRRRQMVATAFMLLGPTNFELQDKDILEMDIVDEQLDTIGKAMMGMTIGCARCHDHKFDPIPTQDYYALAGILKSTKAVIHSNVSTWNKVALPVSPSEQARIDEYELKRKELQSQLAAANKALRKAGGKASKKVTKSKSIPLQSIKGIVLDTSDAKIVGQWVESTSVAHYVGEHYIHDATDAKGQKKVVYKVRLPDSGTYEVRMCYSPGSNRATKVPVTIVDKNGKHERLVNQRKVPPIDKSFISLGQFDFDSQAETLVTISNKDTFDGVVIADAIIFIPQDTKGNVAGTQDIKSQKAKTPSVDTTLIKTLEQKVDSLTAELKQLARSAPKKEMAMVCADEPKPADIHLAIRGVVHNNGPIVPRGFMQVVSAPQPMPIDDQSGRRQLADWIASPEHPLTARVMANRIWYWLIGEGIVTSLDNFGSMGRPPTHPELLDFLAHSFVADGWSVKSLVRKIVTSRTYRMSTVGKSSNVKVDPSNTHLWRMNRKRLRAEAVRDSLLLVGGNLDTAVGGPTIKAGTKVEYNYVFDSKVRSLYLPVFRNTLPESFEVFDFADPNIQQGKRSSSTISSQALFLMNHPFVVTQCRLAAETQLKKNGDPELPALTESVYLQVLGRKPSQGESEIAIKFLQTYKSDLSSGLAALYQALFQSVDFRFLK